MSDQIVFSCEPRGPKVRLRVGNDGKARIVIDDGSRQIAVWPSYAAQIASGIDEALSKVDRDGRLIRRSA
jgi:hypothetical protein